MNPFTEKVIFYDTEFTSLDPYKGEVLSVGLVKMNGDELYLKLECDAEPSAWVKENILPTLVQEKVSREESVKRIKEFVGDTKPYMVGFGNQFDAVYTYKIFGIDNHPFNWLPIDFASILFGMGVDPEKYDNEQWLKDIGVDTNKFKHTHNALDDAKLLREVYLKLSLKQ